MRIMISCGEASGDMYAGALAAELRRRVPDAEIFGFGGPRLKDAGAGATEVQAVADLQFSGRLGELGQPLIRRKADSMLEEFTENLRAALRG